MFLFCHLPRPLFCPIAEVAKYITENELFLSFGYRICLIPVASEIKIWFEKGAKRYRSE